MRLSLQNTLGFAACASLAALVCKSGEMETAFALPYEAGCGGATVSLVVSPRDSNHAVSRGGILGVAARLLPGDQVHRLSLSFSGVHRANKTDPGRLIPDDLRTTKVPPVTLDASKVQHVQNQDADFRDGATKLAIVAKAISTGSKVGKQGWRAATPRKPNQLNSFNVSPT